jgi:hypothetical protein
MIKSKKSDRPVKLLAQRRGMAITCGEFYAERTVDHLLFPFPASQPVPAG